MVKILRRRAILVGLVVAAGVIGVATWTWASPEEREIRAVRNRLKAFAKDVSFVGGGSPFQRLAYPTQLVDYFADPVQFQLAIGPWNSRGVVVQTRAELQEGATAYRAASKGLKVEFLDIAVTLEPSMTQATAHLTSTVHFVGDSDYWVQEFRITLIKESGAWRIQTLATVRTMEQ